MAGPTTSSTPAASESTADQHCGQRREGKSVSRKGHFSEAAISAVVDLAASVVENSRGVGPVLVGWGRGCTHACAIGVCVVLL